MTDDSDPRTTGEFVRHVPGRGDEGDVVVTGVVHAHPASTHRVRAVIESTDPDVLALELPPMAVPLFERYAQDTQRPPASGGEMSAAIQAATPRTVAGIDGPTPAMLGRLAAELYRSDAGLSTLVTLVRGLGSVSKHAVACRLAATFQEVTIFRSAVESSEDHDCVRSDPPGQQAADERAQIRRAASVRNVFGESAAVRLRDEAREAHMANRLSALRKDGTVVAVVGVDHLDPLAARLE